MEKAKLKLSKTKKGYFSVLVVFSNGKSMPIPDLKLSDDSLNEQEVEVNRQKGQIIQIIHQEKVIYSKSKTQDKILKQQKIKNSKPVQSSKNIFSKAPYNFIPLNEKVVTAEEIPDFDKYYNDRYTGYIDIEIKALTPLYIRDTFTDEEYKKKIETQKNDKKQFINPDFFSPGGVYRIPGSSIRGMIRTLVEIMSFGKFTFFDDLRLYYRGLADKCKSLREEYRNVINKKSAGVLHKHGMEYYIKRSEHYKRIDNSEARKLILKIGKNYEHFRHYKVEKGYIIVSGPMQGKKTDWLIEFPDENAEKIKLSEKDIENYKKDKNRSNEVPDLLKLAKDGVPCFYVVHEPEDQESEKRISFGHTGYFRIAYDKTIGDHIRKELKDSKITDIAEAIFGNEKTHSSRIFFEDAYLEGKPEEFLLQPEIPKILSNPKPTSFQHYLEQYEENLNDHPKNLAHYNTDNPIRGYKLYWHRSGNNWKEINKENIEKYNSQYTTITPVKSGSIFRGRIRFENLSKVELGALLFAIKLPEECAHKLGMGKPLGLGSVKITPKLYISDRKKRYQDFFFEWDRLTDETSKIEEFKTEFEKYVLSQLNEGKETLWEIKRIKELRAMLNFDKKPKDDETEYLLESKDFKERRVLPPPTQIMET